MLSGKLVRVRHSRNRLIPSYIDPDQETWVGAAERLLELFRSLTGSTRQEMEEEIQDSIGDQPTQLVHQGLAKLLEDRCEFEVDSTIAPDTLREAVFLAAAAQRKAAPLNRAQVLEEIARNLSITAEQAEQGLFADLKAEQRIIRFDDLTAEQLLNRYNVALAQAILLRSTGVTVNIFGETPARYRQLARSIKFHRLICEIRSNGPESYTLKLDGPLSLFSSTQKYGLQLALFLPTIVQCKRFDLSATVRWGTQRKETQFALNASDGLRSHLPDYGDYTPKDLLLFAELFREKAANWAISSDPALVPLENGFWTPDYELTHLPSGGKVLLEILGFWRKTDVEKHYRRLQAEVKAPFMLAVSEHFNVEESIGADWKSNVYRFKRTPLVDEIVKLAGQILKV
jgi:predicted nuclease of restriction endonuclease-like RecB superfamily